VAAAGTARDRARRFLRGLLRTDRPSSR
jgi:hypothetical protein